MKTTRQRSIWNYLLLAAFALAAGVTILLIAAAIIVPRIIDRTIEKYTDVAPQSGDAVAMPEPTYAALKERVDTFAEAVDAGEPSPPLILTSDEVAALLQREVQAGLNKGEDNPQIQVWLRIEDDQLKGPISVKMDELAVGLLDGLRGRYLNGVAALDVWHANNQIHVRVADFRIDGDSLPRWVLDGLQEAIDTAVADSRELRDLGRKLGGLELVDGTAVIRAKESAQ